MKKLLILLLLPLTIFSQTNWCDSISYSVLQNTNGVFSVIIETTDSLDNYCDTVDVSWGVCNTTLCFSGFGAWASFPIIQLTDTVKVCYNAYIMNIPQPTIPCSDQCDTVVYNGFEWVQFPITNSVGINEVPLRITNNNIYDINGKVITELKNNTIYIRKNKKFIRL